MIACPKCGNTKEFVEIHVGGYRKHSWEQEDNGRFVFNGSNYDKIKDTFFECALCHADMNNQYRKFLQALYQLYDEDRDGI